MSLPDVYQIYAIIYGIALIYLFINRTKLHYATELLCINLILLLIILNPFFKKYIVNHLLNGLIWRAFWLIPITLTLSYVFVETFGWFMKRKRNFILICVLFLIFTVNYCIYTPSNFSLSTNPYKLPQACIDVCDYILEQEDQTKIIAPASLYSYIRQYTSKISLLFGRNIDGYMNGVYEADIIEADNILAKRNPSVSDYETMIEIAHNRNCSYLVIDLNRQNPIDDTTMGQVGFNKLCVIDSRYAIYEIE